MNDIDTQILTPSGAGIGQAAHILGQGGLVAFATETVYGLGADARNGQAVARIFEAKNRPQFNPLIVHVASVEQARRYAQWSDAAEHLAAAFWPGPLTLVLPLCQNHGLSSLVTAGLSTLAIRVPAHPIAVKLLEAFDGPVAAPSANPSGRISPTSAAHVLSGLTGKIEAVLDAGNCSVGLESTIIGLDGAPALLRPGGLPTEIIERAIGQPLQQPAQNEITAPGQLLSHYAPSASVRLNAKSAQPGELFLAFGKMAGDANLSEAGDLTEAAAQLFECLHRLDAAGKPIAVAPIPEIGLGCAINDRLRRAAAPRQA